MPSLINRNRTRKAKETNPDGKERYKNLERQHQEDLKEIEFWKKVTMELAELKKDSQRSD